MKIYVCQEPLRMKDNPEKKREGIRLKINFDSKNYGFVSYYPWEHLGQTNYQSVLDDLQSECSLALTQNLISRAWQDCFVIQRKAINWSIGFKNHSFIQNDLFLMNHPDVVKIKLSGSLDEDFENIYKVTKKFSVIRLDANFKYTQESFTDLCSFLAEIHSLVEYIEDPFPYTDKAYEKDKNPIPIAIDQPYNCHQSKETRLLKILKPNLRFVNQEYSQNIFSNNMSDSHSQWLDFNSLIRWADLSLVHGLITPDLYQGEQSIFEKKGDSFFTITSRIKDIYDQMEECSWTLI